MGAHLVRHGQAEPDDVVAVIGRRRAAAAADDGASPETDAQRRFVRDYLAREGSA